MTYKGVEIGIPEVSQIAEYIAFMGYDLSAEDVYAIYSKNGWRTKKGKAVKCLEAIVNAQNGVAMSREARKEKYAIKNWERRQKKRKIRAKNKGVAYTPTPHPLAPIKVAEGNAMIDRGFIPYKQQLADPRWKKRRKQVLSHKGNKCELCGSTKSLHIHHKRYIQGKYAWEYKMKDLLVLCECCHEKVHGIDLDRRMDFLIETN